MFIIYAINPEKNKGLSRDFTKERDKKVSTWKAAEIAEISLRKMLDELKRRNISGYDEQALKEDLNFALG